MSQAASSDPREALLAKLRLRAEMSSSHGQQVAHLTRVDLTPREGPKSQEPGSDSDSGEDDDRPPSRSHHRGGAFDGNRALQLHSELTARIRLAQSQAASFAANSATSRALPLERLTLAPKPDSIQSLGTLTSIRDGGTMYEDVISFWGIWFVLAAVVRFQRPLRRKRVMDVQVRAARQKESLKLELEQLKNAGLAHDTKRTARRQLQDVVHQSEATAMKQRGAGGGGGGASSARASLASSPLSSLPPSRPRTQQRSVPLHHLLYPKVSPPTSASVPQRSSGGGGAQLSSPRTSSPRLTFEDKMAQRSLRAAASSIAKGSSASGSLAKTLTQHTHSANPVDLMKFMASAGQGPSTQASSAESVPPNHRMPPMAPHAPNPSALDVEDLGTTDVLNRSVCDSATQSLPRPIPVGPLSASVSAAASPESTLRLGSASSSSPFSRRGPWTRQTDSTPAQSTFVHVLDETHAAEMRESIVTRFSEQQRRNASAGLSQPQHLISLDESHFPYVPLPKLHAASSRAYPPPSPRPPSHRSQRHRGSSSDVERNFMRRVETNTFHEDVCHRLKHAELWRQRDYELKKQFLQYHAHNQPPGEHGTVHQLVRDMGQYVDAKRKQDARMERHALRVAWFHNFYESMVERVAWDELESLFLVMEEQIMNAFSQLETDDFRKLFETANRLEILRLPSVQFFLCHVAAAYQVPYITFRELLELSHTPYVLHGNGKSFFAVEVK